MPTTYECIKDLREHAKSRTNGRPFEYHDVDLIEWAADELTRLLEMLAERGEEVYELRKEIREKNDK